MFGSIGLYIRAQYIERMSSGLPRPRELGGSIIYPDMHQQQQCMGSSEEEMGVDVEMANNTDCKQGFQFPRSY